MFRLKSPIVLSLMASAPISLFCWFLLTNSPEVGMDQSDPTVLRNRSRLQGGVERPLSDVGVRPAGLRSGSQSNFGKPYEHTIELGTASCFRNVTLVRGRGTQMDSLLVACENGTNPERKSPYIQPTVFDLESWQKDPQDYLSVAEPGRVFEVAQPSEETPVLKNASATFAEMKEGESVRLSIKTLPKAPASFTVFGNGVFENGIPAITVAADDTGTATAVFSSKTIRRSTVLAGSPVASGTVRFQVEVLGMN